MSNNNKWLIGGIVLLLVMCACVGLACLAVGGFAAFQTIRNSETSIPEFSFPETVTETPLPIRPEETNTPSEEETPAETPDEEVSPTVTVPESNAPAGEDAQETLDTLESEVVPINDPRALAERLEGKSDIPDTMEGLKSPLKVGDKQTFWASNVDTNDNFKVEATLQYVTDHLYFWIEDGVDFNKNDLAQLSETFEKKIYPTDREFFGGEWSPGIDNDVHLYVLYATGLGDSIAGYFSSADELPPQAHQYSNAHEMFMMNADNVRLDDPYTYGTMAHEFQHMIHWYRDRNEESWMNEGFSVLAEFLNGYDIGGFDSLYVSNPDIQLTDWPSTPDSSPHYGQSFLFLAYFLDRFGDKATQALVGDVDNGLDSIDKVLASLKMTDQKTGKVITADDLFADWVVTSYLNNPSVDDGRYAYQRYKDAPTAAATGEIDDCSSAAEPQTVNQYGVNYIQINCSGDYTLKFAGSTEVGVLPVEIQSGDYAFWSNRGDESDMTLTHEFDFSKVSGPVTLNYSAWYDLEEDYDYAYVEASEDGENWTILKTPSGRDKSEDPSGNAYGWGYNGQSNGWIDESVDLSAYAGKKVQIRFEYITDAAVNQNGFMVDQIEIPQINYSQDFETDDGGWEGDGFVRIQNRLPQTFRVSLIENGRTVSVQNITLADNQTASIPLSLGGNVQEATLVVSGTTRFTTQKATYQLSFEK